MKIPDDVDMKVAALIGCGVLTGTGAAMNTADIKKGDTVAVVGCGGVGLNVIQGARIAGAEQIIAIDMNETKLQMAKEFGATATINASQGDPVSQVMSMTEDGADVAFEVIGLGPTIDQTITMTRRGGQAILVGVPRMDVMVNVPAFSASSSRRRRSRAAGTARPTCRRTCPSSSTSTGRASSSSTSSSRGDHARRGQRGLRRHEDRRGRPVGDRLPELELQAAQEAGALAARLHHHQADGRLLGHPGPNGLGRPAGAGVGCPTLRAHG